MNDAVPRVGRKHLPRLRAIGDEADRGSGEQGFDARPVFSAEQFPHARVDACDTCRSYARGRPNLARI